MKLTSHSFKDGDYLGPQHILSADYGFGCGGGNKSPHLTWQGAPAETRSFGVVVNIPPGVTELPLDAGNPAGGTLPRGALQVRTDFGKPGYGGPCPPEGDHPHRYLFSVHAVSMDTLPVTADTAAAVVGFYLNFNTLAKASLMGLYKR